MADSMDGLDWSLVEAWRLAGPVLGIRVIAPFPIELEPDARVWVEVHLPDFGGKAGMVMTTLEGPALSSKFYQSQLSDSYCHFDRENFIEALTDWGWFGEAAERPAWLAAG